MTKIKKSYYELNLHFGYRLRLLRKKRKLTQDNLAKKLNISFQQIQNYEKGGHRISASTMCVLAHILNVDVSYFFQDLPVSVLRGYNLKPVTKNTGLDNRVMKLNGEFVKMDKATQEAVLSICKSLTKRIPGGTCFETDE